MIGGLPFVEDRIPIHLRTWIIGRSGRMMLGAGEGFSFQRSAAARQAHQTQRRPS